MKHNKRIHHHLGRSLRSCLGLDMPEKYDACSNIVVFGTVTYVGHNNGDLSSMLLISWNNIYLNKTILNLSLKNGHISTTMLYVFHFYLHPQNTQHTICSQCSRLPLHLSHTYNLSSVPLLMTYTSVHNKHVTEWPLPWPSNLWMQAPVKRSHKRTLPSSLPLAADNGAT